MRQRMEGDRGRGRSTHSTLRLCRQTTAHTQHTQALPPDYSSHTAHSGSATRLQLTHSTLRLCRQTTAHLILMYNFHLPSSGAFSTYRSASTRLPLATHASTKGYTRWEVGCHWTVGEMSRHTSLHHACVPSPSHTELKTVLLQLATNILTACCSACAPSTWYPMGGGRFDLQNLSSSIHLPQALNAFTLLCQMLQEGGGGGERREGEGQVCAATARPSAVCAVGVLTACLRP